MGETTVRLQILILACAYTLSLVLVGGSADEAKGEGTDNAASAPKAAKVSIDEEDYNVVAAGKRLSMSERRALSKELEASLSMVTQLELVGHEEVSDTNEQAQKYDERITHWMRIGEGEKTLPRDLRTYWWKGIGGAYQKSGDYKMIVSKEVVSLFQTKMRLAKKYDGALQKARKLVGFLNDRDRRKKLVRKIEEAKEIFYGVGDMASLRMVKKGAKYLANLGNERFRRPSVFDLRLVRDREKIKVVKLPGEDGVKQVRITREKEIVTKLVFQTTVNWSDKTKKKAGSNKDLSDYPKPSGFVYLDGGWRYLMAPAD